MDDAQEPSSEHEGMPPGSTSREPDGGSNPGAAWAPPPSTPGGAWGENWPPPPVGCGGARRQPAWPAGPVRLARPQAWRAAGWPEQPPPSPWAPANTPTGPNPPPDPNSSPWPLAQPVAHRLVPGSRRPSRPWGTHRVELPLDARAGSIPAPPQPPQRRHRPPSGGGHPGRTRPRARRVALSAVGVQRRQWLQRQHLREPLR